MYTSRPQRQGPGERPLGSCRGWLWYALAHGLVMGLAVAMGLVLALSLFTA